MELEFHGAADEVTGSCHVVRLAGKTFLLDCGLFQGRRAETTEKNRSFPVDPSHVHSVLLSHAHIDHTGRLPVLTKCGFTGMIYATGATVDLSRLMLRDSAHIQERDAEFVNRRPSRRGQPPVVPLYDAKDVEACLEQFVGMPFDRDFNVLRNLRVRYKFAGHILGAASVLLQSSEGGHNIRLHYSGDIGRIQHPFLREPEAPTHVDYLILESTYGNRLHEPEPNLKEKLRAIVQEAVDRKAKLIVPAFSVGRTQLIIWYLNILFNEKRLPRIPIFVDSPLSTNATEIFRQHFEHFSEELRAVLLHDDDPFGFHALSYIRDVERSKKLNETPGPMMIISASGMCEAGRILHHLRNSIADPNNIVLIVGYQAENTLGRRLLEKREVVKIFGEEVPRRCEVEVIDGFSAHGDQSDLLAYARTCAEGGRLKRIFLVHGEDKARTRLAELLHEELPGVKITKAEPKLRITLE